MGRSIDRYHRQKLLPGWGEPVQRRLAGSAALVVGAGALGSSSSEILVRAGVGRVAIADRDLVELTNLQRQTLYSEADVGKPKAEAAASRLRAINSDVVVESVSEDIRGERALELAESADVIVDGTDNFETRYVLNDAAAARGIPLIYGGAIGTVGTVLPVVPSVGPCLRCVSAELPVVTDTCDTAGVLGAATAIVGARQASLALQLLAGMPVAPRIESIDALTGDSTILDASGLRDPACACCVERRFDFLSIGGEVATVLCGRNSVQLSPPARRSVDASRVAEALRPHGDFAAEGGLLRGRFAAEIGETGDPIGLFVFGDGRAIVSGTNDPARARAVYARYVGG
ncbi:MAG: ThiF family adenylyltransferase [Planctomycetota bacterium]